MSAGDPTRRAREKQNRRVERWLATVPTGAPAGGDGGDIGGVVGDYGGRTQRHTSRPSSLSLDPASMSHRKAKSASPRLPRSDPRRDGSRVLPPIRTTQAKSQPRPSPGSLRAGCHRQERQHTHMAQRPPDSMAEFAAARRELERPKTAAMMEVEDDLELVAALKEQLRLQKQLLEYEQAIEEGTAEDVLPDDLDKVVVRAARQTEGALSKVKEMELKEQLGKLGGHRRHR
eukprot:m.207852 g.207852  ORF g.207852 m.207852 type:complete len:231 (+) comp18524_c0_seq4:437-1129(+)